MHYQKKIIEFDNLLFLIGLVIGPILLYSLFTNKEINITQFQIH
jgi:hypothetical protein